MYKIVVKLHVGGDVVRKVWRYCSADIEDSTKTDVEGAVLELYPAIKKKGLRLKFWYYDTLAGKVKIEGDADM